MLDGRRVAVVNWRDRGHSLAGGSERYAWEVARALRDAGARVDFLTARDRHQGAREVLEGIRVVRRGSQYGFYPAVWWALLRPRLARTPYDVVVDAENGIPVFAPLVVGRRTVVLLVMHHVHQEQFRTYFRRPMSDLGRWLEGWLMPRVYRRVRCLAVSESTREEMVRQLGWDRPVQIVPNGADRPPPAAGPAPDPADTRDRVVVLGRLATHKRIDLVVRALGELVGERPGLRLDVVGRGPELDRLRALTTQLGLDDRVTFHGFLPDAGKDEVLRRARLHVCASDAEGWGQVVVETASYGLPTLARDVPGLRDSIRDGETGWLVADVPHDEERLVGVLEEGLRHALAALDDDVTRERVAGDCRSWAGRFTWDRMRATVAAVVDEELARTRS